ncbi:MAG: LLM class flavin-dependent oxidoreductase [Acidimicrobiia bacterium]
MASGPTRFGAFIAPYHDPRGNPTLQLRRDLDLAVQLDQLAFDEVWFGEHHSAAYEISASPEVMIAAAGERTKRIKLGTGVSSLPYHNPYMLADRIVQLDHLTMGRVLLGMGPGQLPTDAFMMGLDPRNQRDMMIEAAEVIVPLLRGEIVTRKTDWYDLEEARLQLRAFNPDGIDVAVASVLSPTGATLAGRLGLGMLSVSGTDPKAFNALDSSWEILEKNAASSGYVPDRNKWRIVAPMHIAETREQAEREMEHDITSVVRYLEGMARKTAKWGVTAQSTLERWTTAGIPNFGRITVGTPDDAVETIRQLTEKSGGFGTFLLLGHNCADWEATQRSYRLFAEYVIPAVRDLNVARAQSLTWAGDNVERFGGAMAAAIQEAIEKYS